MKQAFTSAVVLTNGTRNFFLLNKAIYQKSNQNSNWNAFDINLQGLQYCTYSETENYAAPTVFV